MVDESRIYPLHPDAVRALTAIVERDIYASRSSQPLALSYDRIGSEYAEQLADTGVIEPLVDGEPLRITALGMRRLEASKAWWTLRRPVDGEA